MQKKSREDTMHKCHFATQVNDYIDNQLTASAKVQFKEHLKVCPVCSGEVERLSKLREQLKTWQVPEAGEGFESSVLNKIVAWELERGDEKMKIKPSVIWVPASVLVGVIVFLFVGQAYLKVSLQGRLQGSAPVQLAKNVNTVKAPVTITDLQRNSYQPYYTPEPETVSSAFLTHRVPQADSFSFGKVT